MSAAVGYLSFLIVACGFPDRDNVEVLDSSSGTWYKAQPVPVGGYHVIHTCWRSLVFVFIQQME